MYLMAVARTSTEEARSFAAILCIRIRGTSGGNASSQFYTMQIKIVPTGPVKKFSSISLSFCRLKKDHTRNFFSALQIFAIACLSTWNTPFKNLFAHERIARFQVYLVRMPPALPGIMCWLLPSSNTCRDFFPIGLVREWTRGMWLRGEETRSVCEWLEHSSCLG